MKKEMLQWILQKLKEKVIQETTTNNQLYTSKTDNLEEMDKFLERYKLPRLNQEKTENMNRQTTSTDIEIVI